MPEPLLELRDITKTFPGVVALDGVSFDVRPGEVHALLGENGAGKSTLIKIIAGAYQPDAGGLIFNGEAVRLASPREAAARGVAVIYQEMSLYPELSVAENIFMGRHPRGPLGSVDWRRMVAGAEALFRTLDVDINVRHKVSRLTVGNRQRVEIAKALSQQARILIMDEPTASLTAHDVEILFGIVRRLRDQGVGIIYISHRLDEVFELADRVTVLRDGKYVGTLDAQEATPDRLISMMVGRTLDNLFPKETVPIGAPVLEVRGLTRSGVVEDISFEVRRGEIVGLSGLVGSGRSDLAQAIFGAHPPDRGEIRIDGKPVHVRTPRDAMRLGIAYVSEDRQRQGLVLPMSVKENVTLAVLTDLTRFGFVRLRDEERQAAQSVERLRVRTPSLMQQVANLSGGNQQKVVLSKWLLRRPKLLILDEPTRGIDVGAKAEIHRLMSELAAQGIGILMISSELPEIMGMSGRVLVMRRGRLVAEFARANATQEAIIAQAMGAPPPAPVAEVIGMPEVPVT
ncbi:MAG: D-xylose ABC transporter ATP-binding protein [Chloroflexi bacterium]|nr:MAG: D-xylose ABC transporter ATP-binding protein [Chloroflexota bacterium]